jgi:hypothetical protein
MLVVMGNATQEEKDKRNTALAKWRKENPEKNAAICARTYARYKERLLVEPGLREKRNASVARYKDKNGARMDLLKEETPCADCGRKYPSYVMDWDHRDPDTKRNVTPRGRTLCMKSFARNHCWEEVLREIAKCDLVCSNCHRIRTHVQRQSRGGRWKSDRVRVA